MPVNIIDTLKPKNGLDFPVVEAVDVAVEGYPSLADAVTHFATDAMISAINAALTGKANAADVSTSVANLQGQIDQIVISASAEAVVAPEVAAARVDEDGVSYTTLKSRLDATDAQRKIDISDVATKSLKQGNLINLETVTTGKYVKNGEEVESATYSYTDYIYVRGGTKYIISRTLSSAGCFYDANKTYINNIYNVAAENYEYTAPASGYIRVNFRTSSIEDEYVIEGTDYTNIKPYGALYNDDLIVEKSQVSGLVSDIDEIYEKVDYIADNLVLKQGNLLDKSTITSGKVIRNNGTIDDNATYGYSDYIPVSAGVHYIISQGLSSAGAIYNSNKEYVDRAYTVSSVTSNYEFTASITGYVRLNFNLSLLDSSFLTLTSSDISDLAPYGKLSNPDLVIKKSQIIDSDASDMNLVIFGDSRTYYNGHPYGEKTKDECRGNICVGYQQTITQMTGATITSEGVSGNTSAQICARILEYDFTGFDAVLLEGGVNDFVKSSSVTIGELQPIGSEFDTSTAYGAWQAAIEYLMTNYPNLKIYVDTPAVCWLGENDTILPYSIAKIKKDVAELYSLPCKDVYNELGITTINRDNFYCDDVELTNNWHLHFNDLGNAKLGEVLAKFILSN